MAVPLMVAVKFKDTFLSLFITAFFPTKVVAFIFYFTNFTHVFVIVVYTEVITNLENYPLK